MKSLNRFLSASHSCLTSSSRRRGSVRLVSALTTALAFGLSACGDDITEINANVGAVETSKDLPECTKDIAGQTAFVSETHEFLGCDGKEWLALGANTVSVGDNVCTSTSLNDGSGFEIFCNGESIGTVKNGKDGAKGEKGDDGAPGAKGDKGDKGADGTNGTNGKDGEPGAAGKDGANGTGCIIKESTALTATIACGSETFTMDLTGYVNVPEECDTTDVACTVPEGDVELGGVSQKGPFVSGTDVTAYELENGKSLKQTGKTFGGKIENKDGSFNIRTVKLRSTYTYLVADGFYRNEVTGKNSAATIKLRALTNLDGRRTANINLVTHLEYDRVQRLVTKENMSVPAAKRAAERELFRTFGIDGDGFKGYAEDFNILKEGEGNGELLAISAMLQGDRNESELTALLAALSVDLGDNGKWDDSLRRAQVADWAMKADLEGRFATIRANVEGWNLVDSKAPAFEQHVTNYWMQELGVGECADGNEGEIFAIKNKKSAYYAANDSAYTDGDSSLVRLICDASGATHAWRYATDLEKDVAALCADLPEDTAVVGMINTGFVYVKEKDDWRRGTDLDIKLQKSCVEDSVGISDSLFVKHEPVWYVCDNGDAEVPYAWREATTAESDTAGFGAPDGEVARTGNKDESHIYVHEDTSGNGDYAWRRGTNLDIVSDLGPCTKNRLNTVVKLPITNNYSAWYTCAVNKIIYENGVVLPYAWREATDIEKDTVGWGKGIITGQIKLGKVNTNLVYVYENGSWRHGTALDRYLGACTENKAARRDTSTSNYKNEYYVCTPQSTPDTLRKWVVAPDIYNDTIGSQAECKAFGKYGDGTILVGRVNQQNKYVCENGVFRAANSEEISANRACVGYIQNHIYKVNGVFSKCVNKQWTRPNGRLMGTLKTSDGQEYRTVVIGELHWLQQNLNRMTGADSGDSIIVSPYKRPDTVLYSYSSSCYDHKQANCDKYGRLYTREAAMRICPTGWHLPTKAEWMNLLFEADADYDSTLSYRLRATTTWTFTSTVSDDRKDVVSFSALGSGGFWSGSFTAIGDQTYYWLPSESSIMVITGHWYFTKGSTTSKYNQFPVRCIQD